MLWKTMCCDITQPKSDMSSSELDELLPWSTKAKQACSLK